MRPTPGPAARLRRTALALVLPLAATACADTGPGAGGPAAEVADPPPAPGELPGPWAAAVDRIEAEYGGRMGVALALPGGSAARAGDLDGGPAWSTSKVPLAVATVRREGAVGPLVESTLTWSDNEGAEALWEGLGGWAAAGAAVDEVLRDGGDEVTRFAEDDATGASIPFGLTPWTLADQAVFGANLPCIDGGEVVSQVMGEVVDDQRYGLGEVPGARFKGGWSPDDDGAYFVRQFGLLPARDPGPAAGGAGGPARPSRAGDYPDYRAEPLPRSFVGVAVAVRPGDGEYGTAMAMLDELAEVIAAHPATGGACR
ncbi:hypothetical protein [Corynebacterium sphenisci]|uniref:hypothetical protein n=1 Tax=Corynebacterium sphenisci TaxID=191493 RepID=UPI0026E00B28|nr:hypothetical protein [Corynebacterium sphenisci]MDO5730423.1 hypothetical protein [Corynebacterium sphenisci]